MELPKDANQLVFIDETPTKKFLKKTLKDTHPEVYKELNFELNVYINADKVTFGSHKKVWWKCSNDGHHEWEAAIYNRTRKNPHGCPICANKTICPIDKCNSLGNDPRFQYLKAEWHPFNEKTIDDYAFSSKSKVLWKCSNDGHHEWEAAIYSRTRKNPHGCPICANRTICSVDKCNSLGNDLRFQYLKPEWHPFNKKSIYDYTFSSMSKVWWKCSKVEHHEWKATINNRTGKNPRGCPICANKTEKKLFSFLKKTYNKLKPKYQYKVDWCRNPKTQFYLPFDFYLHKENIHVIIELHGPQHVKQVSNWLSPSKQWDRDVYKMKQALANSHHVIILYQEDVLSDLNEWKVKLDNAINIIILNSKECPPIICTNSIELQKYNEYHPT